jgi:hypothetical protein
MNMEKSGATLQDAEWLKVIETKVVQDSHYPQSGRLDITASKLCGGDYNTPIKAEFWNHHSDGVHKYKGEVQFTINQLKQNNNNLSLKFKSKTKNSKECGTLLLQNLVTETNYTFGQFLEGGINISAVVCIDFTQSNGEPSDLSSLHHINPAKLNPYQEAIVSVTQILLNYDSDKKIPTYGFGGVPNFPNGIADNKVSHFFPCSGTWTNCEGQGVGGVFQLYNNALNYVRLSGPTYFAPLLAELENFTREELNRSPDNYTVLLILTDGSIHDMDASIDRIVALSGLPISIIIVGVGSANFEKMVRLDADEEPLVGNNGTQKRDIVQFVPFNKFNGDSIALAADVLHEVPGQVTGFYKSIGKKPNPRRQHDPNNVNEAINKYGVTRTGTF